MWKASVLVLSALSAVAYGQMAYDHGRIVACYYSSWAFYRPGIGAFDVDDIDPSLCSHGFYGFADLNNQTWEIDEVDVNFDLGEDECGEDEVCQWDGFNRFTALREDYPHFIPILSIGGWNAGSAEYSQMAANEEYRRTFVESVPPYLKKFGFMGLDIDWEYPGGREGADVENDMENFTILIQELAAALHEEGLLLTAALAAGWGYAEVAYDIPAIKDYFDFVNIMCYDYHGWFPNHEFTGHNAPLRPYDFETVEGHPGYNFTVYDTIKWYTDRGMEIEKMVIGTPTYGRGFQVVDEDEYGMYCPADDGFPMGPYTRQKGHYGYLEALQLFVNDTLLFMPEAEPHEWVRNWDECYKSPYLTNGPYWLGYDDEESLKYKTRYANFLGAAGMMVWSIETDDFGAFYSDHTYPLLRKVNEEMVDNKFFEIDDGIEACQVEAECDIVGDLAESCEEENQQLPYPGSCHEYYRCMDEDGDGNFEVEIFSCGEDVYDPYTKNCIDPNLNDIDELCGGLGGGSGGD